MNNCEQLSPPIFKNDINLNSSCQLTSRSDYSTSELFTGVTDFSYTSYRSFKFILCEYDSSSFSNGTVVYTGYTSTEQKLDPNKYYSYTLYKRQGCIDCVKLTYCNPKSQIQIMSEELALGSGNSLFTNLNELTPLFIVLIGLILGYWFLRKIIKKGQKGGSL